MSTIQVVDFKCNVLLIIIEEMMVMKLQYSKMAGKTFMCVLGQWTQENALLGHWAMGLQVSLESVKKVQPVPQQAM